MNGFMKVLTCILGVLAVAACIATVGIIGYSYIGGGDSNTGKKDISSAQTESSQDNSSNSVLSSLFAKEDPSQVPTSSPQADPNATVVPMAIDPNHVHKYIPTTIKKATCYESGQIRYDCICGDSYIVDQLSTGHVPDEWEVVKEPTATSDGLKVQKCLYCDEVVSSETIPATGTGADSTDPSATATPKHEHLYVSTVEREATCTLAGLRKHTCSCGNFYTEVIPAVGHVAKDWDTAVESTLTSYGTTQRVCAVCGAVLDTKALPPLTPSPNPSSSASASASASPSSSSGSSSSPAKSASPSASPTPHVHLYETYVVTPATCTEKGVRSYVCSCGSSYAESIELDLNNHHFEATFVAPTETQQGYTVYTCTRCNYSYMDNYILPLTNKKSEEESE